VVVLDSNFANAVFSDGVAQFNSLAITTAGEDRYLHATTPGFSGLNGVTSEVFDVAQAVVRITTPLSIIYANGPFALHASIRAGVLPGDPIDPHADGIAVRLALVVCPGYPSSCTPIVLDSNFANAVAVDGLVSFSGLLIGTTGTDRYFATGTPGASGINQTASDVFDVIVGSDIIFKDGFDGQ
jgi:hypothetical protein